MVVAEDLLHDRLVVRQDQSGGVASRVRLTHQLEEAHDIRDVSSETGEFLEQIEHDMWFVVVDQFTEWGQVIVDPECLDLVAEVLNGGQDIVFGFPVTNVLIAHARNIVGRYQFFVHHRDYAHVITWPVGGGLRAGSSSFGY